jgi:hypothetical protein
LDGEKKLHGRENLLRIDSYLLHLNARAIPIA